jgi:hypothetical protein
MGGAMMMLRQEGSGILIKADKVTAAPVADDLTLAIKIGCIRHQAVRYPVSAKQLFRRNRN